MTRHASSKVELQNNTSINLLPYWSLSTRFLFLKLEERIFEPFSLRGHALVYNFSSYMRISYTC